MLYFYKVSWSRIVSDSYLMEVRRDERQEISLIDEVIQRSLWKKNVSYTIHSLELIECVMLQLSTLILRFKHPYCEVHLVQFMIFLKYM